MKKWITKYRRDLLVAFFGIAALFAVIPILTYIFFANDLKSKESIMNRNDTGVVLLDSENMPFFTFYQAKSRTFIPLSQIPKTMQKAVIALEDKEFYNHGGFSIRAIMRAVIDDVKKKELSSGGSTISQQLVKNALLNSQKNFMRKYQEVILAQEIERRYTKDEILEMYLNSVYFGQGAFGVEEASQAYFGKSAKELDLAQSSLLAGILTAPSRLSPISGDINKAKIRQQLTLQKMLEQRYITADEKAKAVSEKIVFSPAKETVNINAPHFALEVRDELIKKFGEERISRSGFKVYTTLNLSWQKYAEQVVKNQVMNLAYNNVSNGAAVVMNPKTGEVLVSVGSKDWFDDKFGKVDMTTAERQPGSSFKPVVYAAAFTDGILTPASVLKDEPTTFKTDPGNKYCTQDYCFYKPENYDKRFRGPVLVRRALANSLNIPAVQTLEKVGVPKAIEMAHRLGVTTLKDPSKYGLSLVLGAGEARLIDMTTVYSTFANQGKRNSPTRIKYIEDKAGAKVYEHTPENENVLDPKYAFQISSILSDSRSRAEAFGGALTISRPAAVKTGTTENYRDAWTIGYTPSLTVGVWVGNNDNKPMDKVAGSLGAAPIWRSLMEKFLNNTPVERFEPPDGIVRLSVCSFNGLLAQQATSSAYTEFFVQGTQPTKNCFAGRTFIPTSPQPTSGQATPQPTSTPTLAPTITSTPSNVPTPEPSSPPPDNGKKNDPKIKVQVQ